jgi:hypothetical protein
MGKLFQGILVVCRNYFPFILFSMDKIEKQEWGYIRTSGSNDYLTIQDIIVQIVTTVRFLNF